MKLDIAPLSLPDVKLISSVLFRDPRGYFCETYSQRDFMAAGIDCTFVQDNQSGSTAAGTVRGLHFQIAPYAQAKLVRVLRGSILDVAVDLRRSSATYGRHVVVELKADSGDQLFVPVGFAHGFCTLESHTVVFYKVDNIYSANHDRGLNWADRSLGIEWPVTEHAAVLSEKDRALPSWQDLPAYFD